MPWWSSLHAYSRRLSPVIRHCLPNKSRIQRFCQNAKAHSHDIRYSHPNETTHISSHTGINSISQTSFRTKLKVILDSWVEHFLRSGFVCFPLYEKSTQEIHAEASGTFSGMGKWLFFRQTAPWILFDKHTFHWVSSNCFFDGLKMAFLLFIIFSIRA